jgi:hypothetical protein
MERDGFVVRESVFGRDELDAMIQASEELVAGLVEGRKGRRFTVGSYTFETDALSLVMLKWEGDTDEIHGIEPFAHLSADLEGWGLDPRLVEPMAAFVEDDEPVLYTEKLNMKRPQIGGPNPLHQDYPYWKPDTPRAPEIATAVLFLDDATLENGCVHVVPGSHTSGAWRGRSDGDPFLANEIDQVAIGDVDLVALPVEAGSLVLFGAFLVHCSAPNTSDGDRRAILFSYQPPVEPCPTQLDLMRRLAESWNP